MARRKATPEKIHPHAYCIKHGRVTVPHPCGDLRMLDGFDSPEGRTQHCPACEAGAHVCGLDDKYRRDLERAIIDAAMERHADRHDWSLEPVLMAKLVRVCEELRKSREART